ARRERAVAAGRAETVDERAWAERVEAAARVQQRLARAMLDLSEPGRSTVVLRYFEGRSAAQIARETGVPESTVRNRLRRALAELRGSLEREYGGDRGQWLAALLPIAGFPRASLLVGPFTAAKVLLMGLKTKILVSASLVLLAALPFIMRGDEGPRADSARPPSAADELQVAQPGLVALDESPARAPAAEVETPAAAPSAVEAAPLAPLPAGMVEVIVVRRGASPSEADIRVTEGRVWLGLTGVFLPRDPQATPAQTRLATLDASGTARFYDVPPGNYPVGVERGQAAIVQAFVAVRSDEGARRVIRLGDGGLRGTVHAPDGPIVSGARLQISRMGEFEERVHVVTWTDVDGRYEALHLPSGSYGVGVDLSGVQNSSGGEYAITIELPAGTVLEHDFGQPQGLPLWRGRVWTTAGEPAVQQSFIGRDGRIHLTRTDKWSYTHHRWEEDGSFAIRLEPGTYEVAVSLPGRDERVLVIEGFTVDRAPNTIARDVECDLQIPGTTVTGFVAKGQWISLRTTPDSRPYVWMPRPADGRYRFDGIEPGRWWLTADDLAAEVVVYETDTVVTVDLR
ncbi:MAG TPA: sigma factor-like helix-turn-helix DNA-binding protein, partial [Planctomycetota bacterium]|nr:sigma factor-like helix-turn-helix DNA-binding protein [Planctomycetota bacterium]